MMQVLILISLGVCCSCLINKEHKVDLWRTEGVESGKTLLCLIDRFDMFVSVELTWLMSRCVNPLFVCTVDLGMNPSILRVTTDHNKRLFNKLDTKHYVPN